VVVVPSTRDDAICCAVGLTGTAFPKFSGIVIV
jgi:hypothetical protein